MLLFGEPDATEDPGSRLVGDLVVGADATEGRNLRPGGEDVLCAVRFGGV